ncbi:phosphate ABC transporter ATP-binding protein [Sphaerobacter thermophilus]|jgi:tungstate transport system ATP-binding protein|uniref:ABC transporter related protein n=1 Tax=Sphaerobacter thermophilus (strain ATCC 49802 / DSM 20745 / KCCM 41009 / NCIMB 13125 / S 6022) TaxID=479434 RepID=D1CAF4_SPHTD|nr:phosphate ABC transporter ATP-binding protein [Sphaerobacter thermophilus]ACZ40797.1 ABC transporter related protein [Sphaerobacter thermophilus DSM 20745]
MSTLYALEHVTVRYGARTVLSIDHLEIPAGEFLAVVGPSGAGKSTLLRLLCFLERPTTGTVRYDGRTWPDGAPLDVRREVTLVFQRPLLLDGTVEQNVAYGLRLRGEPADERVAATLELLGLSHLARARARTLSGGELQRVALGRALVLRPRVLLLDEPTANLDPHNVALIEEAIVALHREYGTTVVIVTHNLHQARRLAPRTAVLLDGHLVEDGPTDVLLEGRGTDPRTRAFVSGEMVY